MRKTAFEIVSAAFEALEKLKPTPREIQDYADLKLDGYGLLDKNYAPDFVNFLEKNGLD